MGTTETYTRLVLPLEDDDPAGIGLDPQFVLPARIAWWASRDADRVYLQEVTGRCVSYGEFLLEIRRWCTTLREHGVRSGDRVISMLPTSIDAAALWIAASCAGALEVSVNPDLRGSFLEHALRDPGARLCFVRPEHVDLPGSVPVAGIDTVVVERDGSFTSAAEPAVIDAWPQPIDPCCVIYTSGTTGASKGVVISWAQMTATIGRIPRSWFGATDAIYCSHPMFHVTGRSPLPAMSDVGGRVVLREKTSVSAFWNDVREFGCTSATVNTGLLLAAPERPDDADNPLHVAFTAGARSLANRFSSRFGVHMVEAYGSTEAGFPIVLREFPSDGNRTCGFLRRGYSARLLDDDGGEVAEGEAGELWVRPPERPLITLGYLGRDDLTATAIVDGWYRTGDALRRQPNGSFEFVDRIKDTIRRLGENISSTALEAAICEDPQVGECAAVGVPDPVAGQEVFVALIPRDGATVDLAALHERLRLRLPKYMVPRYLAVVQQLPRTATNKVRKEDLRVVFQPETVWERPRG
ncbi:MAG: AMP-binding protein [Actinomycetota bacterium]|nr:AMP-binding protein [Actinomycetota bacterium]